jgi:pimeloyl-ACP methyl ester carboxylesterase
MHTTHFVTNDPISAEVLSTGLQTAYYDLGLATTDNLKSEAASKDTLVFVHGFTGSKLDFQDQLSWFADDHRVLAYDQRGHGESSNIGPYNLYSLAADLMGFLNAMGIDKCHILGHSLGGMVVLRALLAEPERFHSAILMDTAPSAMKLFGKKVRRQLSQIVLEGGCEGLLDGMQGQPQNNSVQRGIDYLGEAEHWRRVRVKLEQMDPQAFVELSETLDTQPSVLANLAKLTVPTTIIVGQHDKPFLKPSKKMHKVLPNSELVTNAGAGHSPQNENAHGWAAAVEEHLSNYSRRTALLS